MMKCNFCWCIATIERMLKENYHSSRVKNCFFHEDSKLTVQMRGEWLSNKREKMKNKKIVRKYTCRLTATHRQCAVAPVDDVRICPVVKTKIYHNF